MFLNQYKPRGDKRPPIFHQFYDSWSWKPNAVGIDAMPEPVVGEAAPMKNLEDVFELQILRWRFESKMGIFLIFREWVIMGNFVGNHLINI